MQRWCAFSTPQVHSHPKTLSVPVSPPHHVSISLFHPTLLDFLSPTGSPDDTTALTFFSSLLTISAHIIFSSSDFTSKRFYGKWFYLFPSFIWVCMRRIKPAAQTECLYTKTAKKAPQYTTVESAHAQNIHVCKDNQKPLQQLIPGVLCHRFYASKEKGSQLFFSHF